MPKGNLIDLTGQRFGRLVALRLSEKRVDKEPMWDCQCDCGNVVTVRGKCLRRGETKSCGCYGREVSSKHGKEMLTKHGWYGTRPYKIWCMMKARCTNQNAPNYKLYGGRGITICDEWIDDPKAFCEWAVANGYKDNLTIDRIDTNGNYEPSNCRWVTNIQQQRNKRNNVTLTYNGETKCITEWAEMYGITRSKIYQRIRSGWSDPEEILFGRKKGVCTV